MRTAAVKVRVKAFKDPKVELLQSAARPWLGESAAALRGLIEQINKHEGVYSYIVVAKLESDTPSYDTTHYILHVEKADQIMFLGTLSRVVHLLNRERDSAVGDGVDEP